MLYHHVLAWKACYTYSSAVLFKPTSRTNKKVSISSPSSEGGGPLLRVKSVSFGRKFPLVLLQAKVVGALTILSTAPIGMFPLVLLQAKVVGIYYIEGSGQIFKFPLVLLQAKVVGTTEKQHQEHQARVSISSPSSEGGGNQACKQ